MMRSKVSGLMRSVALVSGIVAFCTQAWAQEAVVGVASAPVKASAAFSAKTIAEITAGTKVRKISQKSDYAEIEFKDGSGKVMRGFVRAAALSQTKSVMSAIGTGKRIDTGATKEALGAAGKGKTTVSAEAVDGALQAGDAKDMGKVLDDIEAQMISEKQLVEFMNDGGLVSRTLK